MHIKGAIESLKSLVRQFGDDVDKEAMDCIIAKLESIREGVDGGHKPPTAAAAPETRKIPVFMSPTRENHGPCARG